MACAFDERPNPEDEPEGFRQRLAASVGAKDYEALKAELVRVREQARAHLNKVLPSAGV